LPSWTATLANNGVKPVTGEAVMKPYTVARTLSIMTSSGMYDYAGEWGLSRRHAGQKRASAAALLRRCGPSSGSAPSRALDDHATACAARLKVCESLSTHFGLHMLNRSGDLLSLSSPIILRRHRLAQSRQRAIRQILEEHNDDVRVIELVVRSPSPPSTTCSASLRKSRRRYLSWTFAASPRSPAPAGCCWRYPAQPDRRHGQAIPHRIDRVSQIWAVIQR